MKRIGISVILMRFFNILILLMTVIQQQLLWPLGYPRGLFSLCISFCTSAVIIVSARKNVSLTDSDRAQGRALDTRAQEIIILSKSNRKRKLHPSVSSDSRANERPNSLCTKKSCSFIILQETKIYCNCFLGQLSELHRSQPGQKAKIIWQIHERLLTHWTCPVSSQFADSPSEWIPTRPAALDADTVSPTAEKSWVTKKSLLLQSSPAWSKDCKEFWGKGTLRRITSLMF